MKKIVRLKYVLLALLLYLSGFSFAQDVVTIDVDVPETSRTYVGAGFGLIYFVPVLHTHVGFGGLLADSVDLRVGLELFPYIYGLTADVLYAPVAPGEPVSFYGGGGARLLLATDFGTSGLSLLPVIGVLGGARFDVGSVDLFTELELDVPLSAAIRDLPLIFVLRSGVNIPF